MGKIIKLNIGSGNEILEEFTSVDLYANCAEIKDDVVTLSTFADNSIDEIRTRHVLEHLKIADVPLAMKSVYRVLKPNGKWDIEVPDLIWLMRDFLQLQDKDRWGWKIQTIFGLQNHDGEYHKTGFSRERLENLLIEAKFRNITVEERFSEVHNQGVINAVAYK